MFSFLFENEETILAQRERMSTEKKFRLREFFCASVEKFARNYAAVDFARSAASSQRTETSFETPGSCIVTP